MMSGRNLAAVLGLVGAYTFAVRPRLLRWGATDEEARRPYQGVDLIPGGRRSATMAVTMLQELPGDRTRLVVSGYWSLRPSWLQPF